MTVKSANRHGAFMRLQASAAVALLCLMLGGCGTMIADAPLVGLPANTPARPAQSGEYLAVHDLPPPRTEAVLTPEQIAKAEQDLVDARNRQAFGAQKPAAKAVPAKPKPAAENRN